MKCPKCGSELDTGFNCPNCGYKRYEVAVSKTEPTTAKMLLWLAENESIGIWCTITEGIIYVWRNGNAVKFKDKTLTEAIIEAYEWAKQEEQKAKISMLKERNNDRD